MGKTLISLFVATAVGITAVGILASGYEEDSKHEHHGEREHDDHEHPERGGASGSAHLSDRGFALYKTECGDCHMAYPPSMLPAASWRNMMGALEDHFGDNAEIDAETAGEIGSFLARNAAGEGRGRYGERSWRATRNGIPPLRITRTDYFRGQHREIPDKMVAGNSDIGSFSRCETCHRRADQGDFDEHGVHIPGYGRWDD